MKPTNRQQFIEFCLRQLGYPVIQIELDWDQLDDIVDFCLSYYYDYHFDGTHKDYLAHQLCQEDIDNGYVTLPDDILFVVDLYLNTLNSSSNLFDVQYQIAINDFFNMSSTQLNYYWTSMAHLQMIDQILNPRTAIRFNRHMNRVFIDPSSRRNLVPGKFVILECYRALDPNIYTDIWSDRWLQRYVTAHFKKLWGEILKKINMALPANVTFNGQQIFDEAMQEIRELEEKMINSYSLPVLDTIA